nr:MAG TPA: hypothetical protein [Caudoviricetes sp.]
MKLWQVFSMNYLIYDKEGKRQGELQNCTSIQWKPRYNDTGTAEIHARKTEDNLKYLNDECRIVCKERREILFIENVLYNTDEIEIHGFMNNLGKRINTTTHTIKNIEGDLFQLVHDNQRGLDINVPELKGIDVNIKGGSDTTYETLEASFLEYCKQGGLGFRVLMNPLEELNTLEIYEGRYRPRAKFSDALGNLTNISYERDYSQYKNYAYVLGEDSGEQRRYVIVDRHKEGEEIRELYVDARDIQSEYEDSNGNKHTYTDEEYNSLLQERGNSKLDEANKSAYKFGFELIPDNQIAVLGSDYDLGDIVPIQSVEYGVHENERITGINFVEEANKDVQITLETEIYSGEVEE